MVKLSSLLWGAAIGAGLVYFNDPQNGNRRKAMVRDRIYHMQNQADNAVEDGIVDLRHRVRGLLADGMAMVSDEPVSDQVLGERIRSRMGLLTRHGSAIDVSVQNHRAVLEGDILADEVDRVIKGVEKVRGVKGVENRMHVHQDAMNIPQLQGESLMQSQNGAQWSPSTRLLASVGAVYLILYGMARGGIIGLLSELSGFVVGARALTNMDMRQMTGMSEEGAVRVRKSILIDAPVDRVYALWSNFENFPQFMDNIESIKNVSGDRSHWVVKGPAGSKVEFDAIMTENKQDQVIAWKTAPDAQVKHAGQVRFKETGQKGTQVSVNMSYTPPAGLAGAAVAAIFGKDPKSEMDQDLARMKSLIEQGKTTAGKSTVTKEQVMPVTGSGKSQSGNRSQRNRSDDSGSGSGMDSSSSTGASSGEDLPSPLMSTDDE